MRFSSIVIAAFLVAAARAGQPLTAAALPPAPEAGCIATIVTVGVLGNGSQDRRSPIAVNWQVGDHVPLPRRCEELIAASQ